ncbi:MAG: addiction module protein [Pirellulaceae bacterium]
MENYLSAISGTWDMTLEKMIGKLSRDEKLAAMDLLWRDLTMDESSFVSPHWHETVIADRLANPATGDALSLDDAKAEITDAINQRRTPG